MVTVEDFSRLVSGIYAAAVTPECWESTVGDVARTLGGTESALLEDGVSRRGRASMLPLVSLATFMGPFELSFATVMGPPGCQ
jgi:hypothetical protein